MPSMMEISGDDHGRCYVESEQKDEESFNNTSRCLEENKTILGVQLLCGDFTQGHHTKLGVIVVNTNDVESSSVVKLRMILCEQIKDLPTSFTFCTQHGWTITNDLEESVQMKRIISDNGIITIQRLYKKPKIGLKTKNGVAIGFVFADYHDNLTKIRHAIQNQVLSSKTAHMDYIFLDSNDWPISVQQEQLLSVIDILHGSCITIHPSCHSNNTFPALQNVDDSPLQPEQPSKKPRLSEISEPEGLSTPNHDQLYQMNGIGSSHQLSNKQILISYVRAEAAQHALHLKQELSSLGFSVYLDVHEIQSGSDWQDSLNNAISTCEVFVPLVTPTYGQTQWTNREVSHADLLTDTVDRKVKLADVLGKFILPVNFLEQWPPRCLAIQFATTQYIHWKTPAQIQTEWAEGHTDSVLDFRIWDTKFIVYVAEKIRDSLVNGGNAKKLPGLTRRKTIVKSCGIVKFSNDQAMTSDRDGRPLIVVCLHPAQTALGFELKAWLEEEDYEVWLTTALTISYPDSLPNSPLLTRNSSLSQDTTLSDCEKQNIEIFQERADDAGIILAVLSKQFGNSRTCQQQVYYCEQRKRLLTLTCETDKTEYPGWISLLMGQTMWQSIYNVNYKDKLLEDIKSCLNPSKRKLTTNTSNGGKIAQKINTLKQKIKTGRSVCITGGEHLEREKLSQIYRSVITHLMSVDDITIATCISSSEICEVISQTVRETEMKSDYFIHIQKDFDKACAVQSNRRVRCGETTEDVHAVIAHIFDVCFLISGNRHTEHLVQQFLWNDHLVVPILCDNPQNNLDKIYQIPPGMEPSDWSILNDVTSSADDIGKSVKKVVEVLLPKPTYNQNKPNPISQLTPSRPLKSALKKKHSPVGQRVTLSNQKTIILS